MAQQCHGAVDSFMDVHKFELSLIQPSETFEAIHCSGHPHTRADDVGSDFTQNVNALAEHPILSQFLKVRAAIEYRRNSIDASVHDIHRAKHRPKWGIQLVGHSGGE